MRLTAYRLVLTIAALVAVSCSSSADPGSRQAVIDAYRLSWAELISAGDPIDPDAPQLRTHRSGQALDSIVAVLREYQNKGLVYRGSVEIHPKVVEFNGNRAKVRDCTFDRTEVVDPATNQVIKPAATKPVWTNTIMERQDGVWKAISFEPEDKECTPEA